MDVSQETSSLDKTSLATISLLESRLRRIEHILYGPSDPPTQAPSSSATASLAQLEHRFNLLIRRFRVYAELLKIRTFLSLPFTITSKLTGGFKQTKPIPHSSTPPPRPNKSSHQRTSRLLPFSRQSSPTPPSFPRPRPP